MLCILGEVLVSLEVVHVTSEPIPDGRHERHLQENEAEPDRGGKEREGEGRVSSSVSKHGLNEQAFTEQDTTKKRYVDVLPCSSTIYIVHTNKSIKFLIDFPTITPLILSTDLIHTNHSWNTPSPHIHIPCRQKQHTTLQNPFPPVHPRPCG